MKKNPQLREEGYKKSNPSQAMWGAFEPYPADESIVEYRIVENIGLPDGLDSSINDLIMLAAMLGSLISPHGRLTIGIRSDGSPTCIEIDLAKLCNADNSRAFMAGMRKTAEVPWNDVMVPVDIEVSDSSGQSDLSVKTPVWLVAHNAQCVLSVRGDVIDRDKFAHLCKITVFACARILNPKATPSPEDLPTHSLYKPSQCTSLVERLFRHKQMNPTSLAIVDDTSKQSVTYANLWNASDTLVRQIYGHITVRRSYPRLALFLERGWQHLACIIAVQRIGGSCILVDPANPDEQIQAFLSETAPDAVLVAGTTTKRALGFGGYPVLEIDKVQISQSQFNWEHKEWTETQDDICFIAGTSGSTGTPKAVCLSYRGMVTTLDTIVESAELGESTRASWLSSPGYGMIEVDPLPVLCTGGTLYIPSAEVLQDIRVLARWFSENNITHTLVMTSIAEALWANQYQTNLRTMLIAGERCKHWPPAKLNYRVLNVYGSAEAAVVSIADLSGPRRTTLPTVGHAVPGANVYIVDGAGQELPKCCVGELVITGETLSIGYIAQNESKRVFRQNTLDQTSSLQYLSGDRARVNLDGTLEIFGRTDRQVKIRGHRVDLTEIEITVLQIQGVAKAAATCFSDSTGMKLVLFLELLPNNPSAINAVRKHIGERLHPAAQPNQINTGVLPLGNNGKVDYAALQACQVERDAKHPVLSPTSETEIILLDCWLSWTSCIEVTLESNFFYSGGDSLRAMRMLGELAWKHGINIEMSPFLENPVFSNLVRLSIVSRNVNLPIFEHLHADLQSQPFELNESQQSLWIGRGNGFKYGGVGCQGYFEWEVKELDVNRFAQAVGLLVDRHPMLRMTIDDAGLQKIGTVDGRQSVEYIDLSDLSQIEINGKVNQIRQRMANEEITTKEWPLFQFVVSRIDTQSFRVHFCIDMLIADAWSIFQVIIPDLIDLYIEERPQLPILKTTFHDYVAYRKKVIQSEQYQTHRKYWLKKIEELPLAPQLPQLEQSESSGPVRFERYEGTLEQTSWSQLKAQAQSRKISPSGVVALALCEVLRCWGEEDRFTLNFPVSDRMPISDDIDLVVGDFTNTLLVPYDPDPNATLETRGQHLQDAIWEALDHRFFTGVEVLRELSRIRRAGRTPLMPIVLTSLLGHPGRHDVAKLGQEVFGVSQTPQVTLDVQIRESEGTLYFKWDYLLGVIRPDVIEAMFKAFSSLLQRLTDDAEVWEYTWIDLRPASQVALRNKVNATQASIPQVHLRELFLERIKDRTDEPFLIEADQIYTWNDIGQAAARINMQIQQLIDASDRFVGIMLPKGAVHYASVYGCLLAGIGYVPIDIDLLPDRVHTMLKQAGVRVVIASPDIVLPTSVHKIEYSTIDLVNSVQQRSDIIVAPIPTPINYVPYVIFTSGSTGTPKGVEIPESAVVNHIFDVVERFGLNALTRYLATAALHFDMSVFDIFGPLVHGGSVVVPEQAVGPDPNTWLRLHRRHKVTFWACVPSIMDLVCSVAETEHAYSAIDSVTNIVMAGDWIPLSLLPRARTIFPSAQMFSCGGPTETTNWSIIHEINEDEGNLCRSVIYGSPMRNSKYHIVANDWTYCPDWVPGEMLVESDVSLANGYIGQPELTQRAFVYHPRTGRRMYRTGDLGRYLPNGEIEILGRIDNQIKINGFRIELGEIESVAQACDGVSRSCAIALLGPNKLPKQIALAYIGEANREPFIMEKLTGFLPTYMVPKTIRQMQHLPLSKNGKIDTFALRKILSRNNNMKEANNSNQKHILREVVRVISDQLDNQVVLPEDNFFDLGGDSLIAMKIKIDLDSKFSTSIPLESIMLSKTISDLANDVATRGEL